MRVPFLDVGRQNAPIAGELREAFARVLASGQYILGDEVEAFEKAAAAVAGARFGVGMSSGTDALLVSLMALGVGPGHEVICPSFTFFATAGCVARTGARPVFADSCRNSFNVDPTSLERLITPRTKAVIPVHLFGEPADLDAVLDLAARRNLTVIEDAAQAFGAEHRGRPVGAIGNCGIVSFYPSKNLGGFGDAGLIVTNDESVARQARLLRNHGAAQQYYHDSIGGNFRLDAIHAALLSAKLPRLGEYTAARQRHAAEYDRLLAGLEPQITLPKTRPCRTHIMNQYTIRVPGGRRDVLRQFLKERGIATAVYYPVPLHQQECFRRFEPGRLAMAELLATEVLSLPIFPELRAEEQATVADGIVEFFERS
jgi:dTDP-4-amino-4,6-dideoxygalactose transaminase